MTRVILVALPACQVPPVFQDRLTASLVIVATQEILVPVVERVLLGPLVVVAQQEQQVAQEELV